MFKTAKFLFWLAIALCFLYGFPGVVNAEYTPAPETITINAPKPLVCINGWVSDNQAHYIQQAAWELGFATYWAEKNQTVTDCDVYFIRGDADTWLQNGHTYTFLGMSRHKARRVLQGWLNTQSISVTELTPAGEVVRIAPTRNANERH